MKKICSFAAIVAASLTLASCGLGTTGTTTTTGTTASSTTSAVSSLLGTTGSSLLSSTTGSNLVGTLLSSILGNTTSQQTLVGTWTYSGPKIVFESENILSSLGGQVVSSNLESKLGTQLGKMGLTAGKSVLTLNADGSCTFSLSNKTLSGTYVYDASTNKLTLTGIFGLGQMTSTVSVQGNQLYMLFDADKLLNVATSLSSNSTSTLSSLIKNYTGLKLGWSMTK